MSNRFTAVIWGSVLALAFLVAPGCGSSGGGNSDGGGGGTGGSTGAAGSPGSGTGGSTGAAGSSAGGAGGSQTDAGGIAAWRCVEGGGVCDCAAATTSGAGCTATYPCCYLAPQAGSEICACTTSYNATQCTSFASTHSGSVVAHCPP